MKHSKRTMWRSAAVLVGLACGGVAAAGDAPTPAEQMAGLETMCADSHEARIHRQAENPLFIRLGEYDKVHELTTEIIRLHNINPDFTRFMADIDGEKLATDVADFLSTGTGGPDVYTGRDMASAHAHLELSTADFLSAGSDVTKAMHNMGYGDEEIQEVICILVSMKDLVVTR
jgi:hemoglobin